MKHKFYSNDELQKLKGKHIRITASHRINSLCRLHVNGMYFRVLDLLPTNELFLEPLPANFKDELQLLPVSMMGIEWGIDDISEGKGDR